MAFVTLTTMAHKDPITAAYLNQGKDNHDFVTDGVDINADLVTETSIKNLAVTEGKLAASAVAAGKLKTTQSTVTNATGGTGAHLYPTNSSYSFAPQFYCSNAGSAFTHTAQWLSQISSSDLGTSAKMCIYLYSAVSGGTDSDLSAIFRYVQTSPPHRFGGVDDWGLFVFLLRDKSTGKLHAMSVAEDPVWDGDWSPLPKGHTGRMAEMPHPFADWFPYSDKLPEDHGLEIVLVDLHELQAPTQHRAGEAALSRLVERRAEWKEAGVDDAELDAYEAQVAAKIETVTMPQWKAMEAASKERGEGSVAELIRKGGMGALAATKEIKTKAALPSLTIKGTAWSSIVHVLKAGD